MVVCFTFIHLNIRAVVDQLTNPSPGFEEVIKTHFRLKKEELLKQVFRQKDFFVLFFK